MYGPYIICDIGDDPDRLRALQVIVQTSIHRQDSLYWVFLGRIVQHGWGLSLSSYNNWVLIFWLLKRLKFCVHKSCGTSQYWVNMFFFLGFFFCISFEKKGGFLTNLVVIDKRPNIYIYIYSLPYDLKLVKLKHHSTIIKIGFYNQLPLPKRWKQHLFCDSQSSSPTWAPHYLAGLMTIN